MSSIFQNFVKFNVILMIAGTLTLVLFYLMQLMVSMDEEVLTPGPRIVMGNITIPDIPPNVKITEPVPDKPEEPILPPIVETFTEGGEGLVIDTIEFLPPIDQIDTSFSPGLTQSNALALVQVQAIYPPRALNRGIEGYVVLEFNISETGFVVDSSILLSQPPGVFDRAALKAIDRWKYNPKVEKGKPVKMYGIQQKMVFTIED